MAALGNVSSSPRRRRAQQGGLDVESRKILQTIAVERHRARRSFALFSLTLALAVAALLVMATMGIAGASHTIPFHTLGSISAETGTWLGVAAPAAPAGAEPAGSPMAAILVVAGCALALWSSLAAAAARHPRR